MSLTHTAFGLLWFAKEILKHQPKVMEEEKYQPTWNAILPLLTKIFQHGENLEVCTYHSQSLYKQEQAIGRLCWEQLTAAQ